MTKTEKAMKDAATQLANISNNNAMSVMEKQELVSRCGMTLGGLYQYLSGKIGKLQVALTIIEQYDNIYGPIRSKTPTQ